MAGGDDGRRPPATSSSSSRRGTAWVPRGPVRPAPAMAGGVDGRTPPATSSSSSLRGKAWVPRGQGPERSLDCQKEGPCSPSPSVSSKASLQQMVPPVQPLKSVDSPPQMVSPVQPSKFPDAAIQLGALFKPPKSVDSRSISCGSGSQKADFPPFHLRHSAPMAGGDDGRTPLATFSSQRREAQAPHGKGHERSSECQKEGPCSSSPSVSSKQTSLQTVTPVQPPKSAGLPPLMVTPVQSPKSLDSPPQMATPVQPLKSVDSLVQLVASVQISKSVDSRSTSCGSGAVMSDPGAAPYDICRTDSKVSVGVKIKPSLHEINREKRRARELSESAYALQYLRPGMVLLKSFLKPEDQVKIVKQCRDLGVGTGGFYQPSYRDGAKLSLRMMCLGKNWDPDSSSYGDIRPFDGAQPPKMPEELTKFVKDAIDASHVFLKERGHGNQYNPKIEIPPMSPDICIVNFYTTAGKLGLHQDKDETVTSLTKKLPVVSFSLGDTAEFLYGDTRDETKASKIKLESGDVLIFGGQSRHIFHGVSSITEKTAPTYVKEANLRPGRLNLTFRQY